MITGLVLAGGRSSRMGTDKAVLKVGGRRLVDSTVQALRTMCAEVLVASGQRVIRGLDVQQIHDAGDGPLGGIVAGLAVARTDLVAVVAVDMPSVDPRLLADLAARWEGEVAVAPRAGDVLQPLHAVYATAWHDRLAAAFAAGARSPAAVVSELGARIVDVDDDRFARNLNRPADLHPGAPRG